MAWREKKPDIDKAVENCILKNFFEDANPRDPEVATAKIDTLSFSVLNHVDVDRMSHVQVVNRSIYDPFKKTPQPHGVLDLRLGICDKKSHCTTCNQQLKDCMGHFGNIPLTLPCFHIGYYREVVRILQMICKNCSRILLPEKERLDFLRAIRGPRVDRRQRMTISKDRIGDACKKNRVCSRCFFVNGTVKKVAGIFKFIHNLQVKTAVLSARAEDEMLFHHAIEFNRSLKEHVHKATLDLNPLTVLKMFERITDEDCELLNFNAQITRPESLIITSLAVPPACIRPSVPVNSSMNNEDDITIRLSEVVYCNQFLKSCFEKGAAISLIMENWDFLQQQVSAVINSDLPGFPKTLANAKPCRSLTQRLKGKQGRFRQNLSGKRVDFSGRTVISPDPNLAIDQVGVPMRIAQMLTYPERVNAYNRERLKQAVLNGPDVWPGANFLETQHQKTFLKYGKRDLLAANLRDGDIVERHIIDGDICLFNRQPSLHRISIMAHRAKVLKWRTLRFNESVCTPYNADFDGDEMNIHIPQTEEARAEAVTLMGVHANICSPRHGEPLVASTQDFLTSSFLITQRDIFYTRAQFCQIVSYVFDGRVQITLPPPSILRPMRLWTGKQVFSVLMRPNNSVEFDMKINIELKARNYEGRDTVMCPRDGYVVVRNSELMCGNICKGVLGGAKNGLFYMVIRDYSNAHAAALMNRIAKLSARWIGNRGFSIGINDVTPSKRLLSLKSQLLDTGYKSCANNIQKFQKGLLNPAPGCDEEQTLESLLLGELSQIREDAGSACLKELDQHANSPLTMAVCGSKGSKINISQMVSCVGQQAVNGKRIPNGFIDRTLPHFAKHSREPAAKGFVQNSFYSGLTATEFFFHTMGGREGLVDTAVKTAETGYMQRRLVKALEDLCVNYDGSVRTANQTIVQLIYGDDCLDPMMMADGLLPVNMPMLLEHVCALNPSPGEQALMPFQLSATAAALPNMALGRDCSGKFVKAVTAFLEKKSAEMAATAEKLGIAPELLEAVAPRGKGKNAISSGGVSGFGPLRALEQCCRVTHTQLEAFLEECRTRFLRSRCEPGTAVGAIAAQSIGEPGTQMTLKTFHFAGVASMNITLGVPRIKEIVNGSRTISSPIITAPLAQNKDVKAARIVKGRIELTKLGDIAAYIEEVFERDHCYLRVQLDLEAIENLQLNTDAYRIADKLREAKKLKLKKHVEVRNERTILVHPPSTDATTMMFNLQSLKTLLPGVDVSGHENCKRAVINVSSSAGGSNTYNLLVEGTNLRGVMGTQGVIGTETCSNHIADVWQCLGIEAARQTIINEIRSVMEDGHGLVVDRRHMALLADLMTFKGEVLGITRFGLAKMKESVMTLASFEQTTDHLFEAAMRGYKDKMEGVSEAIITGDHMRVGTGLFSLHHNPAASVRPPGLPRAPTHTTAAVSKKQARKEKQAAQRANANTAANKTANSASTSSSSSSSSAAVASDEVKEGHVQPVQPVQTAFKPFTTASLLLQNEDHKMDIFL